MNYTIRQEQKNDYQETEAVIKTAFESAEESDQNEHNLVSKIRKSDAFIPELSLVAVDKGDNQVLGHIILSRIFINSDSKKVESLALAPVSVLPEYQNNGIGKELIKESLDKAKQLEFKSVVVLGHPDYYPKFGFKKASLWQIKAPFEVPDEALMVVELREHSLDNVSGTIEYSDAFLE